MGEFGSSIAYQFCPKCTGKLKQETLDDQQPLRCQNEYCRFIFWHTPSPTVAVVITDNEGRVLLTRRNIEPDKGKLDLPGGFMKREETAEEAALREIQEELGVDIVIDAYITTVPDSYYYQGVEEPTLNIAYAAHVVEGQEIQIDTKELVEVVWLHHDELDVGELAFANNEIVLAAYREQRERT